MSSSNNSVNLKSIQSISKVTASLTSSDSSPIFSFAKRVKHSSSSTSSKKTTPEVSNSRYPLVDIISPISQDTPQVLSTLNPLAKEFSFTPSTSSVKNTEVVTSSVKKNYPFYTVEKSIPFLKCSKRGSATLYSRKKYKSFFLLDLFNTELPLNLNGISMLSIYTNRQNFQLRQIKHTSTSVKPNIKYIISNYLFHFSRTYHHSLKSVEFHRYFYRLQQLLLDKYHAINSRISSEMFRNHQTRTFIRFSYGQYITYLGFYIPCKCDGCLQPTAFVMSQDRHYCGVHTNLFKTHRGRLIPDKGKKEFKLLHYDHFIRQLGKEKISFSNRQGIMFSKKFSRIGPDSYGMKGKFKVDFFFLNSYPNISDRQRYRRNRNSLGRISTKIISHFKPPCIRSTPQAKDPPLVQSPLPDSKLKKKLAAAEAEQTKLILQVEKQKQSLQHSPSL